MSSLAPASTWKRWNCPYRLVILLLGGALLLSVFWFTSRYPALLLKSHHLGQALPTMAFSHELVAAQPAQPLWQQVAFTALNWLDGMKIGMSFGVLFGALMHTILKYYPLRVGTNLYLNSLKGAIVGVPAGICANCSVPVACGLTRSRGHMAEVALGFLFSSPNFNPIVVTMTFSALPLSMGVTKYAVLLLVILLLVPWSVGLLGANQAGNSGPVPDGVAGFETDAWLNPCAESFTHVLAEVFGEFGKNVWALAKLTMVIMLAASFLAALMLVFVPWPALLSNLSPWVMLAVAFLATFMPVPIALDVMFAALLLRQGVAPGYVMLFAMTLGTYSIAPAIYLWREVSKPLACGLFLFFMSVGWICGLVF